MPEHYVLVDCDRVQNYVFASPRLREICNASRLLDWIETKRLKDLAMSYGGTTIRSGGGVFLAKFHDSEKARQFKRVAPIIYGQYGNSAVAVDHSVNTPPVDFYEQALLPMQRDLRSKKDSPLDCGFHISTLLAVPCESSGIGAAQQPVDLPDGAVRRVKSTEAKKRLFRHGLAPTSIEEQLQQGFKLRLPYDFGGVVDWTQKERAGKREVPGTSEERMLGIVYADVNSLGQLLPSVSQDEGQYARFAMELRRTIGAALYEALEAILQNAVNRRRTSSDPSPEALPVRVLYIGGDDLAVAIQGYYALDLVTNLLKCFESKSAALLASFSEFPERPSHLTMSAGMVLGPYDYPIQQFNRLGLELEARAKRFGRRSGRFPPPAQVDLCIVKNNAGGDLSQFRHLQRVDDVKLFGGPYTPDELLSMKQGMMALQDFPRKKWKALREVFTISRVNAEYRYIEWWTRLEPNERKGYRLHVCQPLGLLVPPRLPVRNRGYDATPLIDMVELADLLWSARSR